MPPPPAATMMPEGHNNGGEPRWRRGRYVFSTSDTTARHTDRAAPALVGRELRPVPLYPAVCAVLHRRLRLPAGICLLRELTSLVRYRPHALSRLRQLF